MSAHTPGPWLLDGQTVYTLHTLAHVTCNRWSAQVQGYVGCPQSERDANALLIAAAPDLLWALYDVCEWLKATPPGHETVPPECLARALAAIATATGSAA